MATNPIFSNQAWRPLHVRDNFLFLKGDTKQFAGITPVNLGLGANSNPGSFPDVPAVIAIAHAFGEASQPGNIHSVDVEQLFAFAGTTTVTANGNGPGTTTIAAVRGAATIAAGNTFAGGFLYPVHGKITVQGTLSSANFLGAVCGQLDLSAATAISSVNLAAIVADMGATFSAAIISSGQAGLNLALLTSTAPGTLINSVFKVEALATYLFDFSNPSYSSFWFAGAPTTLDGAIAINTPAGVRYIATYATHA